MLVDNNTLDYDYYLNTFEEPEKELVRFRSLVEISRKVNAVSVIMLTKKDNAFIPDLTLGIGEETTGKFRFLFEEPLAKEGFVKREVIVVNEPADQDENLKSKVAEADATYLKRSLFIPCKFQGSEAVLYFGFAKEQDIDIEYFFSQLTK